MNNDPDHRCDVCDVCGSIPQVQQERYTEFQCGSSQSRDGHWHRKVACSVIARLKEELATHQRWLRWLCQGIPWLKHARMRGCTNDQIVELTAIVDGIEAPVRMEEPE